MQHLGIIHQLFKELISPVDIQEIHLLMPRLPVVTSFSLQMVLQKLQKLQVRLTAQDGEHDHFA